MDDDALPPLEAPKPKRAPEKLGDAYQPEEPPPYAREHVVGEDTSTRPSTTTPDAADLSLPTTPDAELSLTQILEKQAASQGRVSPGTGVVGFLLKFPAGRLSQLDKTLRLLRQGPRKRKSSSKPGRAGHSCVEELGLGREEAVAGSHQSRSQSPNLIDALTQMHYVDQYTDGALEDRVRNVKRSAPWGPSRGDESDTGVARWVRSRLASPDSSGAGEAEALATSTPPRGSTPPAPNEGRHATVPASSDDEATFAWRVWKANSLAEERLKGIVNRLLVDADSHPPLLSQHEGDAERELAASDASLRYSSSSAGPESPGDGEDDLLHVHGKWTQETSK
eukprot:g103.t1